MDMKLSLDFAKKYVSLDWEDVAYALSKGYFNTADIIQYTKERIQDDVFVDDAIDLLLSEDRHEVKECLEKICKKAKNNNDSAVAKKFLYLFMRYSYEYEELFEDQLDCLEDIYPEFDAPGELTELMNYGIPWYERMKKWGEYLKYAEKQFTP